VRTSAPPARSNAAAVNGKKPLMLVVTRTDTARFINRARGSRVLNASAGTITDGTFAFGIPEENPSLDYTGKGVAHRCDDIPAPTPHLPESIHPPDRIDRDSHPIVIHRIHGYCECGFSHPP
jgi:hypothetical protein